MTRVDVADCVAWAEAYDGPPFHALLCDPPYELGFMGRAWDRSGVAFNPDTWRALARVLHHGAFGMAFASSRGWHRLACAIEDAGLVIHPSIFGWAFGSGFPKATRIDTQVDKERRRDYVDAAARLGLEIPGNSLHDWTKGRHTPGDAWWERFKEHLRPDQWQAIEREVVGHSDSGLHRGSGTTVSFGKGRGPRENAITAPATPLAAAWAGHRYGLQALKPALEPIIVFQKPYAGRPVDSITATGAGALNVDGGRVPTGGEGRPLRESSGRGDGYVYGAGLAGSRAIGSTVAGRWPANLVVCHTPDCERVGERRVRGRNIETGASQEIDRTNWRVGGRSTAPEIETVAAYACAPGCPVAALGAQSGERASGARVPGARSNGVHPYGLAVGVACEGSTGTAARFYHNPDFALDIAERLAAAEPVRYVAKASRRERNAGCEGMPERSGADKTGRVEGSIGLVGDPSNKGQTANPYANGAAARNPHPTVKPLSLVRHLATLLLPPDAYAPRRLFVPFAGSGSECIGGMLAGWDEVVGVELSDEYAEIARARLTWWEANRPADAPTQLPLAVNE